MAKYIGRRVAMGFWKESTRWTAVAVSKWINKTDCSFDEKTTYVQDEWSISSIWDAKNNYLVNQWSEGDISMHADVNALWRMLLSLLWAPTTSVATTGAYQHIFNLVESNQSQSLTIGVSDPTAGDTRYANAVIDSITISVNAAEIATIVATFKSKIWASTTHTVTYAVDYKLLARHAVFKTATSLAGLWAASATTIRSFEITISKNVEEDMSLWTIAPDDFINKQFSVSWSFTCLYEATTFRDYNLAGTQRAMRLTLADTNTTIWISSNPSLQIDFPLLAFTEFSRTMGNNEVVIQTLNFKPIRSFADASGIAMTVINTTSAY